MQVSVSNGYVLLKETLNRKTSRDFMAMFSDGAVYDENMNIRGITAVNLEKANEFLVLSLVEKIVVVEDGKESYVNPSREWLDNLDARDYKKLELEALRIKNKENEEIKK